MPNPAPVPCPKFVPDTVPRNKVNCAVFALLLSRYGVFAKIRILLDVDDGVIVAASPVVAKLVLVVLTAVELCTLTTCSTRNAPRKLLSWDASRTLPLTNAAGKVVGVAIVLLYPKTGCGSVIPIIP